MGQVVPTNEGQSLDLVYGWSSDSNWAHWDLTG